MKSPTNCLASVSRSMIVIAVLAATGCGCGRTRELEAPIVRPAPAPAERVDPPRLFKDAAVGAMLTYPPGWERKPIDAFVLMLVPEHAPPRSTSDTSTLLWGDHFISLDVPELPAFRPPGFLPMGQIRNGYVGDLRKQMPDATTVFLEPPQVPDAKASLVRSVWPAKRPTHVETALILTHADRVFILRARSPIDDSLSTDEAFDQVVESLRWSGEDRDHGSSLLVTTGHQKS